MPQFIGEQYSKKELAKLAGWQSWGEKMAMLRQMHAQNEVKRQAIVKRQAMIERIAS